MASKIVVDHTELDADGCLVAVFDSGLHGSSDLARQIASLELRAASRDREAIESSNGEDNIC